MTPREQIDALTAGMVNQAPDIIVSCKLTQVHGIRLLLRWKDDGTMVPTAAFEIYRGKTSYATDRVAKGKYSQSKVPPGTYTVFFPDIHDAELSEE